MPAIFALAAAMVLVGAPMTAIPVFTKAVVLALPAALALPMGLPAVWAPGMEPWGLWAANIMAALILLLACWRYFTRVSPRSAGWPLSRGQVWRRTVGAVTIGLVLANITRAVIWSFYTGPSLTIYASTVGISAVGSAVVGALIGAVVGLIAVAFTPGSGQKQPR